MAWASLPQELLYSIAQYVGDEEFRRQPFILTLDKRWYQVAQELIFKDVKLSYYNLHRLPSSASAFYNGLPRHLTTLSIDLIDMMKDSRPKDSNSRKQVFSSRAEQLEISMANIASIVNSSERLKKVALRAPRIWDAADYKDRVDNDGLTFLHNWDLESQGKLRCPCGPLYCNTFSRILTSMAARSITDLHIDVTGMEMDQNRDPQPRHFCKDVASLIPCVRNLFYAGPYICDRLFSISDSEKPVALENLTLQLGGRDRFVRNWVHAEPCIWVSAMRGLVSIRNGPRGVLSSGDRFSLLHSIAIAVDGLYQRSSKRGRYQMEWSYRSCDGWSDKMMVLDVSNRQFRREVRDETGGVTAFSEDKRFDWEQLGSIDIGNFR